MTWSDGPIGVVAQPLNTRTPVIPAANTAIRDLICTVNPLLDYSTLNWSSASRGPDNDQRTGAVQGRYGWLGRAPKGSFAGRRRSVPASDASAWLPVIVSIGTRRRSPGFRSNR